MKQLFTINRNSAGYFASEGLLLLLLLLLTSPQAKGAPAVKRDSITHTPKDSARKKMYGFDISLEYASRQTYYGSYNDTSKLRCLSPEIDYMFKSGITLSISTASLSKTKRVIAEIAPGIGWNYIITDNWFGDIGYTKYISTLPANTIILRRQSLSANDLTACLENDNYVINTSLRFDFLGAGGARDFVFDLQNRHDFDIVYKKDDEYFDVGLRNDLFFGSVNSLDYTSKTVVVETKAKRKKREVIQPAVRTSGVLYDNIGLPFTLQMKRIAIVPELDCSIGNKTFSEVKTLTPKVTYYPHLDNSALLYFAITLDYNLQKNTSRNSQKNTPRK